MQTDPSIPEAQRTIRDDLEVRSHPTVVSLDHLSADGADWITTAYHITRDVEKHLSSLRHVLGQPHGCGIFVIGQYGSGKSHFLSYVAQGLARGTLSGEGPSVVPLSLVNFRAETSLEDIICRALGIEAGGEDRRLEWSRLAARCPGGLLLIVDELSEFLRSKPDDRRFNEDIRFLQFLGEWSQANRFWVMAAMQEGIERVGELEHGLYKKIKDRYPLRFLLTPAHVRDLVSESILIKKPGYAGRVEELARDLREAFPECPLDYDDFCSLYPIHPATLELLEEVRDRFSQARGVVDFTVTRLVGDPARDIPPFLDRPWGSLITPDTIVEHFQELFEMQPEFLPLAQQLLPYYRRHLPELFETETLRHLAGRVLNLLVLVHLSPARTGLSARDAAYWLLFKATRIDPERNIRILEGILKQLVERGSYVVLRDGSYQLDLEDDSAAALERQLEREKADLRRLGETVFESLANALGDAEFNPFALPRDEWQQRSVQWHLHERPYAVYFGNEPPPPRRGLNLCIRLPWGQAQPAPDAFTIEPARLRPGEDVLELAALLQLRERPWSRDAARRIDARLKERLDLFQSQVKNACLSATVIGPTGSPEPPPRVDPSVSLRAWLDAHAESMLRRTYPAFERFAPSDGPLPREAFARFMEFVTEYDLGTYSFDESVVAIRDGYMVPMGLLKRRGQDYHVAGKLESHELVRQVLGVLEQEPEPKTVYELLANPVYGLVPDQVSVLLVFLLVLGELDIVKGGRSLREHYNALPRPIQYDKLVPGCTLSLEHLRQLGELYEGLGLHPPRQWTVFEHRRAVRRLREMGREQTQSFQKLLRKLNEIETEERDERAGLAGKLGRLLSYWAVLESGNHELRALEAFLQEIGSPQRFLALQRELGGMSERLEGLLRELARFRHLLGSPAVKACRDTGLSIRIEALGTPPGLDEPDALEAWLKEARAVYEEYKEDYARRHAAWWDARASHPFWSWKPPDVARSRHVGLDRQLEALRASRDRAGKLRCSGLVNLDYQPVCACGFDGESSPVEEELGRFTELREAIERALTLFFKDDAVKQRLESWVEHGFERNDRTLAYLEGREPVPEVKNIELFDRHLAGVQLVKEVDAGGVWDLLGERTWERHSLLAAFDSFLSRFGSARLRFQDSRGSSAVSAALAVWCVEHALRHGAALPKGLGSADHETMRSALRPEWVGPRALERLDMLGLSDGSCDRIVTWLCEGQVEAVPGRKVSPLVAAALEIVRPTSPSTCEELARLSETLYRQHARLLRAAGERWLERLELLTQADPPSPVADLVERLEAHRGAQWLIVDCLGLPLLGMLRENLETLFPGWRLEALEFALVSTTTTTDACYRQLVEAGFNQRLEKINVIDTLLHERFLSFDDFSRLSAAELHVACGRLREKLDPGAPLVVFADHGFRISPDGGSYSHGGSSTLERLVPFLSMVPG